MAGRTLAYAGIGVLVVGLSAVGVWWQRERTAAQARASVLAAADTELQRDPIDRGGLVQADRDLAKLSATDHEPSLLQARARIAIVQRLPDDALRLLDEVKFQGRSGTPDLDLRAQALALRHAVGGRIDDAQEAAAQALEHFEATQSVASAFLAWQSAIRIGDADASQNIAQRLQAVNPQAWQSKVAHALLAFDPGNAESVALLRQLQLEAPPVPELETALAAVDLADSDTSVRDRGVATIRRVLAEVPASKPARLIAVFAHDRIGDFAGRNVHLQWLVTNFPHDDRVDSWRQMSLAK